MNGKQTIAHAVGDGEIHGVVAFANVEGSAIGLRQTPMPFRNQDVRIGVSVAMSVRAEIVGDQEIADLEKLALSARRDRLQPLERSTAAP